MFDGCFIDRNPNPLFGEYQSSNIVDAEIKEVHKDEAGNVTLTATVTSVKGEKKIRVPFLFPYASVQGNAGIFAVPNVGDHCLVALTAGNLGYVIGYHPAVQLEPGRASSAVAAGGEGGASLKGTYASTELREGCIEIKSPFGNRILVHSGGPISIDSKVDLFTYYDSVKDTIETMARSTKLFTAGGSMVWQEGEEVSKRSMTFEAEMFTKAATEESLDRDRVGELRGGARMRILFGEVANYFYIEVLDQNNISGRIQIGPNGVILTASDGTNQGSIVISPGGNFSMVAGDPNGMHSQLDLSPNAAAITSLSGSTTLATVITEGSGKVTLSSKKDVVIDAPRTNTQGGMTFLGALGGFPSAKVLDTVKVPGIFPGLATAVGFIDTGSSKVFTTM